MTQIKRKNGAGVQDALKQLLEVQIKMWRAYKENSTLETKSWTAQLSPGARRELGSYRSHDQEQAVSTAGPKAFPMARG